jgi:RNA polymerase sigma-70 factor (ECF subfamily)
MAKKRVGPSADVEMMWVLASQRGDHVAFNRLVLKWEKQIYNLVLRMLNDPEEAAETTQEVFLSAFQAINKFKGDSRFSTWIYRIAVNKSLTRLRRRPLQLESIDPPTSAQLQVSGGQEERMLRLEKQNRVRKSLANLPADQRVVLELKFFQEETFQTIAEILQIPLSTVKSRFYNALGLLRQRLETIYEEGL